MKEFYISVGNDIIAEDADVYSCITCSDLGNSHNRLDQCWVIAKEKPNKKLLDKVIRSASGDRMSVISLKKFSNIPQFMCINHMFGITIFWENDLEKMMESADRGDLWRYNISEILPESHPDYPNK